VIGRYCIGCGYHLFGTPNSNPHPSPDTYPETASPPGNFRSLPRLRLAGRKDLRPDADSPATNAELAPIRERSQPTS
jgi:hypothetical protein